MRRQSRPVLDTFEHRTATDLLLGNAVQLHGVADVECIDDEILQKKCIPRMVGADPLVLRILIVLREGDQLVIRSSSNVDARTAPACIRIGTDTKRPCFHRILGSQFPDG